MKKKNRLLQARCAINPAVRLGEDGISDILEVIQSELLNVLGTHLDEEHKELYVTAVVFEFGAKPKEAQEKDKDPSGDAAEMVAPVDEELEESPEAEPKLTPDADLPAGEKFDDN